MTPTSPAPVPRPLPYWPVAPLTALQINRHRAQVQAMQDRRVARWPQGVLA